MFAKKKAKKKTVRIMGVAIRDIKTGEIITNKDIMPYRTLERNEPGLVDTEGINKIMKEY